MITETQAPGISMTAQEAQDLAAQNAREWKQRTQAVQKKLADEKQQNEQKRSAAVAAFDAIAGGNAFAAEVRQVECGLNDRLFQANRQVKDAENRAAQLTAEIETLRTQFAASCAAKDARISALEKEVQAERNSREGAAGKAASLVASFGFKAVAMEPDNDGLSALEQYNSIKDPVAKGRFFDEHREQILGK